ncbi:MAG: hypothetical protein JNM70_18890 [Anaerolineae bacterium]|nr:hypothetical protein [Anaerolineae bacterium]
MIRTNPMPTPTIPSVQWRAWRSRIDWGLLAAVALALPLIVVTPLLVGNLPGTNDAELHLHRLISAALNWREGVIWGRWAPQLHFGYGYPIGNFYAPGWHILGGALVALGLPAVGVWLSVQAAGVLLYPVGAYLWGREFGSRAGALVGAALFTYAPLRFFELFSQGNLSQFLAMGLMAWAAWGLTRCARQPSPGRMVTAAGLLAALIVTHHPTAALFVPVAGVMALAGPLLMGRRPWATLAAFGLGLLLSAVYWLPAVAEADSVRLQSAADQYPAADWLAPPAELLAPNAAPNPAVLNEVRALPTGQPALILVAVGVGALFVPGMKRSRWQTGFVLGGAALFILCLYVDTYQAAWVWEALAVARYILYPWRFLGLALLAAIPPAISLWGQPRLPGWTALVAVVVLIGAAHPLLRPRLPDVVIPEPVTPGTSIRYEIASGNLGAVATAEYTPRWAEERPTAEPDPDFYDGWNWNIRPLMQALPAGVKVTQEDGAQRTGTRFDIEAEAGFTFVLRQFYFPGWAATVDGRPAALGIQEPNGLLSLEVPAGQHVVEVWYAGTPIQQAADGLLLVGLAICAGLIVRGHRMKPAMSEPPASGLHPRLAGAVIVGCLIYAVVMAGPRGEAQPSDLKLPDLTTRLGTVYRAEDGTGLLELVGVRTTVPESVQAGDWVYLDLVWRALQPLDVDWRMAVQVIDPTQQIVWAGTDNGAPGGFSTTRWPTDRLVIDRHILRIRADGPPYVAEVRARVYAPDGGELRADGPGVGRLRILNADCSIPAEAVRVDVRFGERLTVRAYRWEAQGAGGCWNCTGRWRPRRRWTRR